LSHSFSFEIRSLSFALQAQFLGQRGYVGDEFVTKVVESMAFGKFIQEYAAPFRIQTLFDEVSPVQ